MSDSDSSGNGLKVAGGIGAAILAALAGFAKFGDDALRLVLGHAHDVGRGVVRSADDIGAGVMHQADDFGRGVAQHGDDFSRSGLPQFKDPPRITTPTDGAMGGRVHVPSTLLRSSRTGQGGEGDKEQK